MPHVLIVEDDPVSVLIYNRLLERASYSVTVATNGIEAIEMLETNEIHAVVTDLLMPKMDGHELCDRIRADERWAELPIIVVTGVTEPEKLAWIDGYPNIQLLEKPVKVANLIETLGAKLSHEPARLTTPLDEREPLLGIDHLNGVFMEFSEETAVCTCRHSWRVVRNLVREACWGAISDLLRDLHENREIGFDDAMAPMKA